MWFYLGVGLQVAGVAVSAGAYIQTWTSQGGEGGVWGLVKHWLQPVADPTKRTAVRGWHRFRQLVGKPDVRDIEGHGGMRAPAASVSGTGPDDFVRLPNPTDDLSHFAAAVQDQIDRLNGLVQKASEGVAKERKARDSAVSGLRTEIAATGSESKAAIKAAVISPLRVLMTGWLCVLVGIVLAAAGSTPS